jgi:hypothetical protein
MHPKGAKGPKYRNFRVWGNDLSSKSGKMLIELISG